LSRLYSLSSPFVLSVNTQPPSPPAFCFIAFTLFPLVSQFS
jgi:hypothetical protein